MRSISDVISLWMFLSDSGIEYGNNTDEVASRAYRKYLSEAAIVSDPLPGLATYWRPEPLVPSWVDAEEGENMSSKSEEGMGICYWSLSGLEACGPLSEQIAEFGSKRRPVVLMIGISTTDSTSRDGCSSHSEDEHGDSLVDFATIDPLSLQHKPDDSLMEIARAVVREKGFGTCGPRGFYGRQDPPHLSNLRYCRYCR